MRNALGYALILALAALTACSSSQPPALQGSWTDQTALAQGCGGSVALAVTLDLTQEGATLGGTFTVHDGYGGSSDLAGTFGGSVTAAGQITGETVLTQDGSGTGPAVKLDVSGTYDAESGVLATDFVGTDETDCNGDGSNMVRITIDASLTK